MVDGGNPRIALGSYRGSPTVPTGFVGTTEWPKGAIDSGTLLAAQGKNGGYHVHSAPRRLLRGAVPRGGRLVEKSCSGPETVVNSKLKTLLVVSGVLLVAFLLALPKLSLGGGDEGAGPGGPGGPGGGPGGGALVVDLYVVEPNPLLDRTLATGSLMAEESVDLRAEVGGRLVEVAFEEGGMVEAGALLARVNDRDLQARLQALEARGRLLEQREFRQSRLLAEGGVSAEELEETRAELEVLEADKELVRADIEKTELRAPFRGRVGFREVSPGSLISPDTRITTVQVLDPLRLEFSVPARFAPRVASGQRVLFRAEGSERDYEAVIYAVEPGLEESTRTLRIRARTPNPDGALFPGSFASVEVILEEFDAALSVPSIAVRPDLDGPRVFVFRGGEAQVVPVRLGVRTRESVQVVDGLSPGDSVIVTGFQQLRPGREVEVGEVTRPDPDEETPGTLLDDDPAAGLPGADGEAP
ncbi:MAG: efflux RND transporter periplasmic adaptor subunit [Gemmatimonadales bacterium]|nr:MAG: efflux RND transporter periplasmic adaptor subunit [Gemmatimonadales bacterium]